MKEQLFKFSVKKAAAEALLTMLNDINKEPSTNIKKQDFLSYIIIDYSKLLFSKRINSIVKANQSPIDIAKETLSQLKSLKKNGASREEVASLYKKLSK